MRDPSDSVYQPILDRLQLGDDKAIRDLTDLAYDRLRRLVAKIMNQSFPGVRRDVDSVLNETWLRLYQALQKAKPPTSADFFRFAAFKVRQVLLDMVAQGNRLKAKETPFASPPESDMSWDFGPIDAGTDSIDPARLEQWTQFHDAVDKLPEDVREVFVLKYYLNMTQADIAVTLSKEPKQVSRLWLKATGALADQLPD